MKNRGKVQKSILTYTNSPKESHTDAGSEEEVEIETNPNAETEDQTKIVETVMNDFGLVITKGEFEQFNALPKPIPVTKNIYETPESKRKRKITYCNNTFTKGIVLYSCTYHARADRYNSDHQCFQYLKGNANNNREIDSYFTPEFKGLDLKKLTILQHICLTGAQLHYSANSLCSPNLYNLAIHIFKEGQANPNAKAEDMVPKLYPKVIKETHIMLADKHKRSQIIYARDHGPVSISLDAGSTKKTHYLVIMVQNIKMQVKPFEYKSIELNNSDADTYKLIGKQVIKSLQEENIKVCCFVGDRLPAQIKALAHWHPYSLCQEEEFKYLLYVPCSCHLLNSAIAKTIKENLLLNTTNSKMITLERLLRKPVFTKRMNCLPKSYSPTRWVFLYDCARNAIKKKEKFEKLIQKPDKEIEKIMKEEDFKQFANGIPFEITELEQLLKPLKLLMSSIEGDMIPLWVVKPLKDHAIQILKNLDLIYFSDERQKLIDNIEHYYEYSIELMNAAYSLTSSGRYELRKELSDSFITNFNENEAHCNVPTLKGYQILDPAKSSDNEEDNPSVGESDEEIIIDTSEDHEEIDNTNDDTEEEEELPVENDPFSIVQVIPDVELRQKTLLEYYSKINIDNDEMEKENLQVNTWPHLNDAKKENCRQQVYYVIENLGKNLGKDNTWIILAQHEFDDFISTDVNSMLDGETLKTHQTLFWHNQLGGQRYGKLAVIASILLALPASEACCERYISIRGDAVNRKQTRMKNDEQAARTLLASTKKDIF